MRTYMTSLGCPKNLVDAEASLSLLTANGCSLTEDPSDAELLIVNACSFLDIAWRETVEEVERLARMKETGTPKKLVLMGCLPRHREVNLAEELPLVDHFLPTGAHAQLPAIVAGWRTEAADADTVEAAEWSMLTPHDADRFAAFETRAVLTPSHTAYVKIAEGCSRRCTFCAIPKIRGRMVSRPVASIIREIENLMEQGVREVSLLAQDITSYIDDGRRFPDLVDEIVATGIDWIRIFYVHPGSLTMKLAERLFHHEAVCRYLEAPIQHASDTVLKRMRRPYTRARLHNLFRALHREYPDLRVRSEVIVGFPGETDADFDALREFVSEADFASLGIFRYSPESNTPAAVLDGIVAPDVMEARATDLESLQQAVSLGLHDRERDRVHRVLVDRVVEGPDEAGDGCSHVGRYYGQAFEVDGHILLTGADLATGQFANVRITDTDFYDMRGEVI